VADEPQVEPSGSAGGIPRWKLVLWAVVAVYAVAFLLLNSSKQEVSFVFFSVNTRLIWLILLSMGLGAVLANILPRWWRSRRAR
jgi:hypothetical protein